MSATIQLNSARFVKRASSGASLSKYGYIGMMQQLADAIMSVPWAEVVADEVTLTTNQITKTDGVLDENTGRWTTAPTYTAYMDGKYDAFAQAGDGVARNATMCGYMGCVAYRFAVPPSESANVLQSVKLSLQRDRYLRAGVRVGMQISSSETPSDDWSVIRGEAAGCVRSASTAPGEGVVGVESFGLLGQTDVPNLMASAAAAAKVDFDTSASFTGLTSATYLWVYVTLEDPAAHWTMYSETESRQYFIEGSAMLMAESCSFTFQTEPSWAQASLVEVQISQYRTDGDLNAVKNDCFPVEINDIVRASDICCPAAFYGRVPFETGYAANNGARPDAYRNDNGYTSLAAAYASFRSDRMVRCIEDEGSTTRSPLQESMGAAFFAGFNNGTVDFAISVNSQARYLPVIFRKKLLVSFMLKKGFELRRMRLTWRRETSFAVYNTNKVRHSVWLVPNEITYDSPEVQRHELWTAETNAVGKCILVDSWEETYPLEAYSERTNDDADRTREMDVPWKSGLIGKLLLTVYVDYDQFSFDASASEEIAPSGISAMGEDTQFSGRTDLFWYQGVLPGGWNPTITLLGTQT